MPVLDSRLDPRSSSYEDNRAAMLQRLAELDTALRQAVQGGGDKYVERHRKRGKLLARERVELLLDRDAPFLELAALAGWGTDSGVGAGVVTGIGVVEGVTCMVIANDPTVRGGAVNPYSLKKTRRAAEIARVNRLPLINLVESGGADLPNQAEIFIPGGGVFRDLTQLSAAGIPTIAVVFGNATAGGAYIPGMSDYTIFVRDRAKVFLAGPPLVKMATGEDTDDEALGGAAMHATTSGLADFLAEDERDAIRLARATVARLNRRPTLPGISDPPRYDAEDLLGIPSADPRIPFDPREILARILDGSEFDEFKPAYGTALCTGWGRIHGCPVGILANARGILFSQEAQKAAQFIQLANQSRTPLLFLQNTTGYMVGTEYEQAGIIKHGALMINAVANSTVPHLTVTIGASYGAGNYGMCGRAYDPRFLFTWPNAKSAVMGPAQLSGVLSIIARQAAQARGKPYDEERDAQMRAMVEQQIEQESAALFLSGRLYDDGVIDPRDTRTVLGLCLSVVQHEADRPGYGVFRM
ncbi:acyl-CoA carboxylase subunit beta [Planosporangium thailandense]|uniref:Acyl-CoA carboxylase subunit beta n=1 Tax=Planosporangium thailandense TaxID=765197 RepID=A0ABX0XT30_9ACTN|nr:carboxyl transferase domain-containing protein [Planosporangium thailandense]NJC69167.1 acyl-CoA carboxylase subunit beta [Planosporangium thailandense]